MFLLGGGWGGKGEPNKKPRTVKPSDLNKCLPSQLCGVQKHSKPPLTTMEQSTFVERSKKKNHTKDRTQDFQPKLRKPLLFYQLPLDLISALYCGNHELSNAT